MPGETMTEEMMTEDPMPGDVLSGRVALVTGASRGLGAAVAVELARLGAHVVLTARTQGGLEDTDDAIRAIGGTATLLPLDLREPDRLEAIGPSIFTRFGRLDILVHAAAALGKLTPVGHATADDRTEVLAVNTIAPWRLIQGCDAILRRSDMGRAVFVTDTRATEPLAYWGPYGASKSAAHHLVHLGRRDRGDTAARQSVRPRPDAHAAARHRLSGRAPGAAPHPGGRGGGAVRLVPAGGDTAWAGDPPPLTQTPCPRQSA